MRVRTKTIYQYVTHKSAGNYEAQYYAYGPSGLEYVEYTSDYPASSSVSTDRWSWMQDTVGSPYTAHAVKHMTVYKNMSISLEDVYNRWTAVDGNPMGDGYQKLISDWHKADQLRRSTTQVDTLQWAPSLVAPPSSSDIPRVWIDWKTDTDVDNRALQQLLDKARQPVIDGLLNIVEAPELKDTARSIKHDWDDINRPDALSMKTRWQRFRSRVKKLSNSAKAPKRLANYHLAYAFGVAPVISDVKRMHSYMEYIARDYDKFKNGAIRKLSISINGSLAKTGLDSGEYSTQLVGDYSPKTRYVLVYRDRNPYSTEFMAKLHFLLKRFGGQGPAYFAWERIPFSFVIDWFLDTRSLLSGLNNMLQADPIEIISLTKSQKCIVTVDLFRTVRRADTEEIVYDKRQGYVTHKWYERSVQAQPLYLGLSNRFGKNQAALTSFLIVSRLKVK